MGIQGFFNYLNKKTKDKTPSNEKINGILEVIPSQPQKNYPPLSRSPNKRDILGSLPRFDIVLFDFQSLIYAVSATYEEIDKLIILLHTIIFDVPLYNKYKTYYSNQIIDILKPFFH